ncbi:DNA-processing protein DprA [Paraburkholderia megapolitana]|uniref:DNA protecting protein DprA n=1 Tax=Paraburkholderia megapolitana TaxID=420953 RepID=A0A1I3UTB0_9BURK|nr:DNA-processing protein DprA [Paraburkholderia megapolitana]QDQ82365.1 DNA-protecting protein DprA [Paraburkholderia megapolitana]SFJ86448.1 DNA protecting protein DprA [Paraburkholderia megapolitana]
MHALPMTGDELAGWLRLAMAKGLSPTALRLLLDTFGLPDAVLGQQYASLAAIAGEAAARAALAAPSADFPGYVDTVRKWCEGHGNAVVTLADPAYPPMLLTMPDPPPLLYVKGRIDRLHVPGIAVVGSRSATPQGIEDAERFARAFSDVGVVVVSGLALGIDGAAHRGALAGSAGTVAVIGTGADLVYPAAHHALAHQIAQSGAIMTEWPLGTPARSAHFPQRNRLIAGLVRGVLIVEAAMRSGSLITARLANEMGRDVFALPGSIHAPLSRGSHRMIKQGAKLVETPEEVLEELALNAATAVTAVTADQPEGWPQGVAPAGSSLAPDAQRLLDALGHAPATLEILAARTEMDDTTLQSMLLQLELAGHLTVLQGGRFIRAHHGQ